MNLIKIIKVLVVPLSIVLLSQTICYAGEADAEIASLNSKIDKLWVLLSAALVFLMQAGFKSFEVGMVRSNHTTSVGMKNLIDWVVVSLIFFLVGFGFMFGKSWYGIIGTDLFIISNLNQPGGSELGIVFFLFQLAFAGTALTIVSGAMSERTGFIPYLTASLLIGLIIYPIFGHWAWGNLFFADNKAWLADLGFMDFAGSTVVHSVGAWVALVGVWIVGPRLGRYNSAGEAQPFTPYSYAYSVLGVFILWFGWWGFNGGSTLAFDGSVSKIILNTNLAAAAAGITAFFHSFYFQNKKDIYGKLMGGVLTGLVAITAGANVMSFTGAILVGSLAGLVHNYSFDFISYKLKLDDPVGAIAVHGFGGAFGTLAVGIFGQQSMLALPRTEQIAIQLMGIVVCFVFTTSLAYFLFQILKKTVGLRVSPVEENNGISLDKEQKSHDESNPDEEIDEETLLQLMAEMDSENDTK